MNNTTANTNLPTMTPKQIDELLLDLYREEFTLVRDYDYAVRQATYVYGDAKCPAGMVVRQVSEALGRFSTEEFFVLASDYDASPCELTATGNYEVRTHRNNNALIDVTLAYLTDKRVSFADAATVIKTSDKTEKGDNVRAVAKRLFEVRELINAIDDEFARRGGWTRYWLVTSSNGHIHSSTSCHTCHKGKQNTTFALVYHLSGEVAERAVEVFGPALCSVCYPEAPVEMTDQAKVTASLASVYFDEGYEGWVAAKAKAEARKAKKEARVA